MRVGQSTKRAVATASGQRGYIGEKGIGFKSVFKVADVVQIASGFYEFKLDRSGPLGMILPILTPFPPADRISGHTQILLHLKDGVYNHILEDLRSIDSQLLIFLSKLKRIRVATPRPPKAYVLYRNYRNDAVKWETAVISSEGSQVGDGYIVKRHELQNLPADSRRKGITSSEIVLAFPTYAGDIPRIDLQNVYAFLPIGNFGFRVSSHVFFILLGCLPVHGAQLRSTVPNPCRFSACRKQGEPRISVAMEYRPSRRSLRCFR